MADIDHYSICPFCKALNNCQAHGKGRCWCVDLNVPPALLELVPLPAKNQACICLGCLQAYQADPVGFIARISG